MNVCLFSFVNKNIPHFEYSYIRNTFPKASTHSLNIRMDNKFVSIENCTLTLNYLFETLQKEIKNTVLDYYAYNSKIICSTLEEIINKNESKYLKIVYIHWKIGNEHYFFMFRYN